jgi:hypothetical protein
MVSRAAIITGPRKRPSNPNASNATDDSDQHEHEWNPRSLSVQGGQNDIFQQNCGANTGETGSHQPSAAGGHRPVHGGADGIGDLSRQTFTGTAASDRQRVIRRHATVAQYQEQRNQGRHKRNSRCSSAPPQGAGPGRDMFGVHPAKPFYLDLGCRAAPPPGLKIFAGDRRARDPARDRNSALLQLIERPCARASLPCAT